MIRFQIFIIFIILCFNTCFSQISEYNDPKKYPYQVNKIFVDSIAGKSIEYYLNHPNIDNYSKAFYKKDFAVSDDDITFSITDSVFTKNIETRPFYIFIFNSIVDLSDGALSEIVSLNCFEFIKQNTCEFIRLKYCKDYNLLYNKWVDLAAFGSYPYEENFNSILNEFITESKDSCSGYKKDLDILKENLLIRFREFTE